MRLRLREEHITILLVSVCAWLGWGFLFALGFRAWHYMFQWPWLSLKALWNALKEMPW